MRIIQKIFFFIPFLLFFSGVFCFSSCKKKIERYNGDFSGTWRTDTLVLTSNGSKVVCLLKIDGKYSYYGFMCEGLCNGMPCNCLDNQFGKAKVSTNKKIWIGGKTNNQLKIITEPYQDASGRWVCKLGDDLYYKY
jgi:hypothetical protein